MKILKQDNYLYSFSQENRPIISIRPGETLLVKCTDNVNLKIKTDKDVDEFKPPFNALSGPIYVERSEPGDTLVVHIKDVKVPKEWSQGYTAQSASVGACMSGSDLSPVLNNPIPTVVKVCRIRDERIYFPLKNGKELIIPLEPMIGTIGTTPLIEHSSVDLGKFGGNMDAPDVHVGNKIYLPVFVKGGLLLMGDFHGAQGDGELGGAAMEIPAECIIAVDLIKNKMTRWPRIESPDYIMTVGNARPLDDAMRVAAVEMVHLLEDEYHFNRWDANLLLGNVAKIVVNTVTNPKYSIGVKIHKKYLK